MSKTVAADTGEGGFNRCLGIYCLDATLAGAFAARCAPDTRSRLLKGASACARMRQSNELSRLCTERAKGGEDGRRFWTVATYGAAFKAGF
jgi:hypothetical protein